MFPQELNRNQLLGPLPLISALALLLLHGRKFHGFHEDEPTANRTLLSLYVWNSEMPKVWPLKTHKPLS